jgi:hypothetical protein
MSKSAFTLKVFGIYLLVLGPGLILLPNLILSLFGIAQTSEVWIRVAGVLVLNIGIYYGVAAQSEAKPLFLASVYTRVLVFASFVIFALSGLVSPAVILFGSVDLAGGLWTLFALNAEKKRIA